MAYIKLAFLLHLSTLAEDGGTESSVIPLVKALASRKVETMGAGAMSGQSRHISTTATARKS